MNLLQRTFSKLAIIFLLLAPNVAFCSQSIFIYRDFAHKGDENQVRGVVHAYTILHKDTVVTEFNVGNEDELTSSIKTAIKRDQSKPIVLAVGEKTVSPYGDMLPFEGAKTAHLSHMITSHHPKLVGKVDFIALPVHAIDDFEKTLLGTRTKLIPTVGVSHNRQIETIERAYKSNRSEIPPSDNYIGVILSGDAPTSDGKIKLFTEENARELAHYVSAIMGDKHLLIINGPRTGKHDGNLQEIKDGHRGGKIDLVTQAFLDELSSSHIDPKRFTLLDFQFDSKRMGDMDLLLGAIRATKSAILVPGESTSSISESIDVLPQGSVTVYETKSMNNVHEAHVRSELDAGRIKFLAKGFKIIEEPKPAGESKALVTQRSAAETIAMALLNEGAMR
jgi:hypothetical protein